MKEEIIEKFKKEFSGIKEKEPLKKHTTMRVGGAAKLFYEAKDIDDLKKIVKKTFSENVPYIVIGNGSNIIFADVGVDALVIKNSTGRLIFESSEAIVDGGMPIARLLRKLAEAGLGGLEFLAGIPGTIGGAVYGNAGAYGGSLADVVRGVLVLDVDGKVVQIGKDEMKFKYRSSHLKEAAKIHDRFKMPVILQVRLRVSPKPKEGILRGINNYIKIRLGKYPTKPSSGSVFKNVEASEYPKLAKDLKVKIIDGKIPSGFLIETIGGKDLKIGDAEVSKEHANFIINSGRARAYDIKELSKLVKEKVKEEFGVILEEEIEFVGNFSVEPKGIFSKIFK